MTTTFRQSAISGIKDYLPLCLGQLPWALASGVAMKSAGFSLWECIGMTLIVYSGSAQLGTLPLIVSGASIFVVGLTTIALALRFLIFSALMAPAFEGCNKKVKIWAGYVMSDGVIAAYSQKILADPQLESRTGLYLGTSSFNVMTWMLGTVVGAVFTQQIPEEYHFEFMATIALAILLAPALKQWKAAAVCLVSGLTACLLIQLPMRLGFFIAILAGLGTGALFETLERKRK
ncbi:AzlC family ABC transporter permease [Leeia sp. TBRC 13508]|uniref:AzlC family ABC transporter permease n=1 Tax=Leeia speluncae TaxID=2884804 RepID=A0ABS8DA22_9NEIS|nr:AzlC family ABC transporter permease [Leeia speluncae]MCB6185007.1 AzlC family ABC transporter permease [Leeia speluncae]